jgi:DNA-binding CsgD family transcriptional regulator
VVVDQLRIADVRRIVDFVSETSVVDGPDAFPAPMLERLADLIPCVQLMYWDFDADRPQPHIENHGLEFPPAVEEASSAFACQLEALYACRPAGDVLFKLSDLVSRRELVSLDFYQEAMRPVGVEDELKLWLEPGSRRAGFSFLLDRSYSDRDRLVLDALATYLANRRERAALNGSRSARRADVDLSEREWEVLEWLARGKTNKEIAATLAISPNTVRKHVEHVFDKLGVHTRTAAVARAFLGSPRSSIQRSGASPRGATARKARLP